MTTRATPRKAPSLLQLAGTVEVCAAEPADAAKPDATPKARTFKMEGYTGADMNIWGEKVAFDLSGMTAPKAAFPALRQHDPERIAGRVTTATIDEKGVHLVGVLSGLTDDGKQIAAMSDDGHPWQASMRWSVPAGGYEEVDKGETAQVNGREFQGPGLIARKSHIREASFCTLGADGETNAVAAALDGAPEIEVTRRKTMSEPTKTGATLADLKAAFPKDREFALDQFEAGATIAEAKAAYADVLEAKLTVADAQIAAASKPAPAGRVPSPARAPLSVSATSGPSVMGIAGMGIAAMIANDVPANAGPAAINYFEALAAFKTKGFDDGAARGEISKRYPDVQAAYLNEVNGTVGKSADQGGWERFPMKTAKGEIRK